MKLGGNPVHLLTRSALVGLPGVKLTIAVALHVEPEYFGVVDRQ